MKTQGNGPVYVYARFDEEQIAVEEPNSVR